MSTEAAPDVQVEITDSGPCRKTIEVSIPRERVSQEREQNLGELGRQVQLPGFRRGKVPRKLIEKKFGDHVDEEVKEQLVHETLFDVIDDEELQPIGEPQVEDMTYDPDSDPGLVYRVALEVRPEFELPEVEAIEVDRTPVEADEEEIEEAIDRLRRSAASIATVDEPAGPDDVLLADLVVRDPETEEEVVAHEDVEISLEEEAVGGAEVPGLAERLEGIEADETRVLDHTLPEAFPIPEYAGEEATLEITAREVKQLQMPEPTDEWAAELGYDDLAELRQELTSDILRRKESQQDREVEEEILDRLVQRIDLELPENLVRQEERRALRRKMFELRMQGMDQDEAEKAVEERRDENADEVREVLERSFVVDRLAEENKIFVTESEVEERIAAMAKSRNKWPNEVKEDLEERDLIPQLRAEIRSEKVREWLRENATVREKVQ